MYEYRETSKIPTRRRRTVTRCTPNVVRHASRVTSHAPPLHRLLFSSRQQRESLAALMHPREPARLAERLRPVPVERLGGSPPNASRPRPQTRRTPGCASTPPRRAPRNMGRCRAQVRRVDQHSVAADSSAEPSARSTACSSRDAARDGDRVAIDDFAFFLPPPRAPPPPPRARPEDERRASPRRRALGRARVLRRRRSRTSHAGHSRGDTRFSSASNARSASARLFAACVEPGMHLARRPPRPSRASAFSGRTLSLFSTRELNMRSTHGRAAAGQVVQKHAQVAGVARATT